MLRRCAAARLSHHLQSAGTVVEPCQGQAPASRVYALEWMERWPSAWHARAEKPGSARQRRPRRMSISDITPRRRAGSRPHRRDDGGAGGRGPAPLAVAAVKGGEAPQNAAALVRLFDANMWLIVTSCFSTPPPHSSCGQADNLREGALMAAKAIDEARKACSGKLIAVSNSQ